VTGVNLVRGFESLPLRRGRTRPPSCLGVTMRPQARTVERELARLARSSHGVVTRTQLLAAGLTRAEIKRRAVLSGRAAGHLLGILPGPPPPPEVTTPTERRVPGVRTHRSRSSLSPDAQFWRGVPVTSPARTLVDLAATLDIEALARAAHEAGIRHDTAPREIEAVLARGTRWKGAPLPRAPDTSRPAAPADQQTSEPALRRLPLARPPPHRRARRLPLPQVTPRLGVGPPPRARGLRPR
jgi:hypothetical protein